MDVLVKLKAFASTAELGSFSDAARKLNASPSVIMKRINELEQDFRVRLFTRTTRRVVLTDEGQAYLIRAQELLRYFDDMRQGRFMASNVLEGSVRIRSSIVSTLHHLGRLFIQFQRENPGVSLHVTLADGMTNPIEDGVDVAIGFFPIVYDDVSETLLNPYTRVTCASPAYLEERGVPAHPHDLAKHRCIAYLWGGPVWTFGSRHGNVSVNVHPVMTTNNPSYLREIALAGLGIVQISRPAVADCLQNKTLVEVLDGFTLEQEWMKILVPDQRLPIERIRRFSEFIKDGCADTAPWA